MRRPRRVRQPTGPLLRGIRIGAIIAIVTGLLLTLAWGLEALVGGAVLLLFAGVFAHVVAEDRLSRNGSGDHESVRGLSYGLVGIPALMLLAASGGMLATNPTLGQVLAYGAIIVLIVRGLVRSRS